MSKGVLVAPRKVPPEAVRVYPEFAGRIERSLKVATPLTAFTVVVPKSVAPIELPPSATVTVSLALMTALPKVSVIVTTTAGVIAPPATALLG